MASPLTRALLPIPRDRRAFRASTLVVGLALYGFSMGLMLLAGLGLAPWGVLDQGLARAIGGSVGVWSMIMGAVVLLLWIPLRQRPGIGTLCNVVLVGTAIDLTLWALPTPTALGIASPCWPRGSRSTPWPPRCTSAPDSARARATAS